MIRLQPHGMIFVVALSLSGCSCAQSTDDAALSRSSEVYQPQAPIRKLESGAMSTASASAAPASHFSGPLSLSVSKKPTWDAAWVGLSKGSNLASEERLTSGDFVRICLTPAKDGYAKLWMVSSENGTVNRSQLLPNEHTKGKPYVTSDNTSITVKAGQPVCLGEEASAYLKVSAGSQGVYRVFAQWQPQPAQLFNTGSFSNFTKGLDDLGESAPELSADGFASERSLPDQNSAVFVYRVK